VQPTVACIRILVSDCILNTLYTHACFEYTQQYDSKYSKEANPVLLGFDVVHYHFIPSFREGGVAKQGLPEFAYNFKGYQFWFSSNENRDLFIRDPWK
jgi:hypothetical protein